MFARVTVTQGPPERVAELIRYIEEHIIPSPWRADPEPQEQRRPV